GLHFFTCCLRMIRESDMLFEPDDFEFAAGPAKFLFQLVKLFHDRMVDEMDVAQIYDNFARRAVMSDAILQTQPVRKHSRIVNRDLRMARIGFLDVDLRLPRRFERYAVKQMQEELDDHAAEDADEHIGRQCHDDGGHENDELLFADLIGLDELARVSQAE